MSKLILGTRGSDLALTQTRMVEAALCRAHPGFECEVKIIKTIGDQRQDLKLTEFSSEAIVDKGIFTKELEVALAAGEVDLAVHSLKDVPTELEETFVISAVLERADTRDVLLTKAPCGKLAELPEGARLATSSVRRQAQLQWLRSDLQVEEIRGNVPTRLSKLLKDGGMDGILLAMAGLKRLGYLGETGDGDGEATHIDWEGQRIHVTPLGPPEFLAACGQGAIALETRADDAETRAKLEPINDAETFTRITAERLILERLQAGCHTPVGVDTGIEGDELRIHLRVFDEAQLSAPPREARVTGASSGNHLEGLIDQLMNSLND